MTPPQSDSESEDMHLALLDDWDNWFGTVDSDINPSESDHYDEIMDDYYSPFFFYSSDQHTKQKKIVWKSPHSTYS